MVDIRIRNATAADLERLTEIERQSFTTDRLSRRSLRRLIARRPADVRVAGGRRTVAGYHVVLFRRGSAIARLYSIAVDAACRGRGVGERLLADAEALARRRRARVLRLEVRVDNAAAIRLYEGRGYRLIGRRAKYYADNADALRYEKQLREAGEPIAGRADNDRGSRGDTPPPAPMRRKRSPGASRRAPRARG